jgi:tRNA threonylcarbamoyladenosine biosynthesis protein TsaE
MNIVIDLPTEEASERMAEKLAANVTTPLVMTFSGNIGAGKTTLIRALLRSLGIHSAIKSPTFSLVESYQIDDLLIHHFDLYRIQSETELDDIGFRDYFAEDALCCIEWPERLIHYLNQVDIAFSLAIKGMGRALHARANTEAGAAILSYFTRM